MAGRLAAGLLVVEGFASLFRGLAPILLKEVPFVVTKFVVFDAASEALATALQDGGSGSLLLPLLAGSIAGL